MILFWEANWNIPAKTQWNKKAGKQQSVAEKVAEKAAAYYYC